MLIELSPIDAGSSDLGLTRGFVFALPGADGPAGEALVDALRTAAEGVKRVWALDIPNKVDETPLCAFTTSRVEIPYHETIGAGAPLPPLSPSSPSGEVHPFIAPHFRHPKTPHTLKQHAKDCHPLLSIHVTRFADAVALGVSAPHGVFDGTGLAQVLKGIGAGLRGEEWTPPPLHERNPVTTVRERLMGPDFAALDAQAAEKPPVLQGWTPFSVLALLSLLLQALWENWWHKDALRYAFISREKVDALVEEVKAEVKMETDGKEWVSTGDVLTAWVLKNLHTVDSSAPGSVSCSPVFNVRSLFSGATPDLAPHLATHTGNAVVPYPLSPTSIPFTHLASMSAGALALLHRRTLSACKSLPWLRAMLLAGERASNGGRVPYVPARDWPWRIDRKGGTTRWIVSNHMGSFAGLRIPRATVGGANADGEGEGDLPLLAYYRHVAAPLNLNGAFALQLSDMGVFIVASARKVRWESLMRAIAALDRRDS
ncbi:hypothetical protein JCM10449v2_004615 [Rhodotorula kratochvilovae]